MDVAVARNRRAAAHFDCFRTFSDRRKICIIVHTNDRADGQVMDDGIEHIAQAAAAAAANASIAYIL